MLEKIYGTEYTGSSSQKNISAITFAGTVLGQLIFGYTSDKWSRSNSLLLSTVILIVFAALSAGSYGAAGNIQGMFAALTAYRFLVGIGIGGEYPAGSVACSEASGELKSGTRNRWFIIFTNVMIDWGFVIGAFVPYLLVVMENLLGPWCCSSTYSIMAANQASRARRIQKVRLPLQSMVVWLMPSEGRV
jgi:MFS family permease